MTVGELVLREVFTVEVVEGADLDTIRVYPDVLDADGHTEAIVVDGDELHIYATNVELHYRRRGPDPSSSSGTVLYDRVSSSSDRPLHEVGRERRDVVLPVLDELMRETFG